MSKSDDDAMMLGVALLFLLGAGGESPTPKGPDGFKKPDDEDKPEPKPEPEKDDERIPGIDDIVDGYPTPGMFYQVQAGDFGLRVAARALKTAAFLAARDRMGMTEADALDFASNWGGNAQRQYAYLDAITCESWNDTTVTTHGYGDQTRAAPSTRRAIRFLPQHANNLQRLRNGRAPQRRMNFGTPADKLNEVKRTGNGSSFETLYLPGVNLKAIADGDGLKLGGGKWPDGSSKRHPPEWVLNLGVRDKSGSMAKNKKPRGCSPSASIEVT